MFYSFHIHKITVSTGVVGIARCLNRAVCSRAMLLSWVELTWLYSLRFLITDVSPSTFSGAPSTCDHRTLMRWMEWNVEYTFLSTRAAPKTVWALEWGALLTSATAPYANAVLSIYEPSHANIWKHGTTMKHNLSSPITNSLLGTKGQRAWA